MQRAVCPGSFDPVHNGHIEIIVRAASLFEEVVVAVSNNPSKSYRLRLQMLLEMFSDSPRFIQGVTMMPLVTWLIVDFPKNQGARDILKVIRNTTDLNYQMPIATFIRHLLSIETVFLPADSRY